MEEGKEEQRDKREREREKESKRIIFGQSNIPEFALDHKNIHSEKATSSGHMKEIQELLSQRSSNFKDG